MDKQEILKTAAKELIQKGNTDVINTLFSSEYIAHSNEKQYKGHAFLKRWSKQVHAAIDQININKITFLTQDKNTVTWQRTLSGVHRNDFKGIPASDKTVHWTEMVVSRFENEKIIEEWVVSELAGALMLKQ